jgi:translocation and assembly module TamB
MKSKFKPKSTQSQLTNNLPDNSRRWLKLFLKTGSAICLGLFLLLIIGIGYGQWWAKRHLAPIVAKELSKSLKRSIDLGQIEDIWLNEVRISNAKIPANGSDLNSLEVRDIVINFNPFQLAFDRTLKLNVHVISPNIYLAQNTQGSWVNIPAQEKTPPSPIKVEVGTIKIDDARIVIVPYSKKPQPITVSKINLQADVSDAQDLVDFRVEHNLAIGDRYRFREIV